MDDTCDHGWSRRSLRVLLFSHYKYHIGTMQSAVTGQAPKTLQGKITSGRKQSISQRLFTITETNGIRQTKQKGEISVRIYQDTYGVYHMLDESWQKPKAKARKQPSTCRKKRGCKTNDVQLEIEKGISKT